MTPAERKRRQRSNLKNRRSENHKARKRYRQKQRDTEAQRRREASRNAPPLPDGAEMRVGNVLAGALDDIEDNTVALILTDPPYGLGAELLYEWLGPFSARVLIPGGSLICFGGNLVEARDQRIFDAHLTRQPQCIMPLSPSQRLFGPNAIACHRPIHWYTKGRRRGASMMPTVFISAGPDKIAHAWAQGDGGVWVPIYHLSELGELILDPFCGTGTWGRIAADMGRRWIGADIVRGGTETIAAGSLTPPEHDPPHQPAAHPVDAGQQLRPAPVGSRYV
jgi:hypothetical protein